MVIALLLLVLGCVLYVLVCSTAALLKAIAAALNSQSMHVPSSAAWTPPAPAPAPGPETLQAWAHPRPKKKKRTQPPRGSPCRFVKGTLSLAGVKFALDQNVSNAVARKLRELGLNVVTTHEAGLYGASDAKQIRFCAASRRIWVTHDLKAKEHVKQMAHAGVLFVEGGGKYPDEIVRWCLLLANKTPKLCAQTGGQKS